jgi:hypothetical protein
MYTKTEKKDLRLKFWNEFNSFSARKRRRLSLAPKWAGEHTGIRGINLKFHFDEDEAIVAIDVVARDIDSRIALYDKLETIRKLLEEALGETLIWDLEYTLESGKEISRVYVRFKEVSIYNMSSWPDVMVFFYNKMIRLEPIVLEYKDYLNDKII